LERPSLAGKFIHSYSVTLYIIVCWICDIYTHTSLPKNPCREGNRTRGRRVIHGELSESPHQWCDGS
jgi:hypothetical protein